ncbi:SGNH/GDSL hydrolase family protein [Neobacillus sp. FSL H8-0543]|uniref:SGNH/GDSL hydrolase family protein n=1 Tax=Neobacillus sp. FSL H8-0543 TaxID=2954672 RepID=UPI003158A38C
MNIVNNARICYDLTVRYKERSGGMSKGRKFKSLLLVGTLVFSLPISAWAKAPEKKVIDYVALGDSLAAGATPFKGKDLGYPDYLTQRFEQSQYTVDFDNFAVNGYQSRHVLNDILVKDHVRGGIEEAEFITLDIGGNDILPVVLTGGNVPAAIASAVGNIHIILKTIDALNPNAKVYVMGYFNVLPYLRHEQQQALLQVLDAFNSGIEKAAIANGDTFVPTAKIIAKNYQTYLPNPNDIHLSLEGYQIVAKEFWKYIDKSKSK